MNYSDSQDINVVGLIKGREKYIFLYDDESSTELFRVFDRFASNPELSFNLFDTEVLSDKIRQAEQLQQIGGRRW